MNTITVTLPKSLELWLDIMEKRTGIQKEDLVQYALLAASEPLGVAPFAFYIQNNYGYKVRKELKTIKRVKELDKQNASFYFLSETEIEEDWEVARKKCYKQQINSLQI